MLNDNFTSKKRLRWQIYSITSLILIIIWGVVFLNLWHSWQSTIITERTVSQNLARSLAAHTAEVLKSINYRLENIKNSLMQSGPLPRFSKQGTEIIKGHIASSEYIFSAHYFDSEGDIQQSAIPTNGGLHKPPEKIINVADKEFFKALKFSASAEDKDKDFFIGRPIKGEITGEWTLPIARALYNSSGIFDGVVMAAIQVKQFEKLYESFDFHKDSSVALARKDGIFISRTPFNPLFFSKNFSENIFFSHYIKVDQNGHFEDQSSIDGHTRLISFQSIPNQPLVATVTLDKSHLISEWLYEEITILIIAIFSTLFLFFLAHSIWVRTLIVVNQRDELEKAVADRTEELVEANQKLEHLAQIDGLTGIANRRHMEEHLDIEFRRAQRSNTTISVAMIDIDHFKDFNDTYGHMEGDECLKHVASVLNSFMRRSTDLLARYGGEEFICLLPETDESSAYHLAEQLRQSVENKKIGSQTTGESRSVTVSIGIATMIPRQGDSYDQLIKSADIALYQAKDDGRNLVRKAIK